MKQTSDTLDSIHSREKKKSEQAVEEGAKREKKGEKR